MKKVFVIGYPRSGTTWVFALLAEHPDVAGFQQGGIFHALSPLQTWWTSMGGHGKRLVSGRRNGEGRETRQIGDLLTKAHYVRHAKALIEDVFSAIAQAAGGADVVVEQTPENLELAEEILSVAPDAYFLHVIRDPRAVYCSQRAADRGWAHGGFRSSPSVVAGGWIDYMARAATLTAATSRYLEVKYEDLVDDGPRQLRRMLTWLELSHDEAFCTRALANCSIEKLRASSLGPKGFFRKGETSSWLTDASRGKVRCIEYLAGREMAVKGYESFSKPPISKPLRLTLSSLLASTALPVVTVARKTATLTEYWLARLT